MFISEPRIIALLIALALLGGWWCWAIIRRLPDDLEQVRCGDDPIHRGVIIAYWVFTMPVALGTLWLAWLSIAGLIRLFT